MEVIEYFFRKLNLQILSLEGKLIALDIDPDANRSGNALQIFAVGPKEDIRCLKIIKDDLLNRFGWLLLQILIFTPSTIKVGSFYKPIIALQPQYYNTFGLFSRAMPSTPCNSALLAALARWRSGQG